MKFCEGSPPQGPSGARRGSTVFSDMLIITDPPRGRPFGNGGVHPNVVCGTNLGIRYFLMFIVLVKIPVTTCFF